MVAGGSLAFRLAFFGRKSPAKLPEAFRRAMDYVPAAVLAALALPEFFSLSSLSLGPALAFLAAILTAWLTGRDFLSIATGLAVYWIFV
jgi:branched-subunit amino acid transport protein